MKTGKGSVSFWLRGSSKIDLVRSSVISTCGLTGSYLALCSPSYCSAPQTWQTVAHRLMRDRHRRHILNRLRHPQKRRRQRCKDEKNDVWEYCELPSFCQAATPRV